MNVTERLVLETLADGGSATSRTPDSDSFWILASANKGSRTTIGGRAIRSLQEKGYLSDDAQITEAGGEAFMQDMAKVE